jgi:hypothetical protein
MFNSFWTTFPPNIEIYIKSQKILAAFEHLTAALGYLNTNESPGWLSNFLKIKNASQNIAANFLFQVFFHKNELLMIL